MKEDIELKKNEGENQETTVATNHDKHRLLLIAAVVGALATLVAWAAFFFDNTVAITAACIGQVLSIAGTFSGKGCLRDIAITSMIASLVLIIVYATFLIGLNYVERFI